MTDFALSLSTTLAPHKQFLVDSVPYDMLGVDHLSPEDEAEVTALFARFGVLDSELSVTRNIEKGKGIAKAMKGTRIQLLCKLTSMPKDVAEKLPMIQQTKLLDALAALLDEDEDAPVQES